MSIEKLEFNNHDLSDFPLIESGITVLNSLEDVSFDLGVITERENSKVGAARGSLLLQVIAKVDNEYNPYPWIDKSEKVIDLLSEHLYDPDSLMISPPLIEFADRYTPYKNEEERRLTAFHLPWIIGNRAVGDGRIEELRVVIVSPFNREHFRFNPSFDYNYKKQAAKGKAVIMPDIIDL